jgi:PAS domain S-box-containing protein
MIRTLLAVAESQNLISSIFIGIFLTFLSGVFAYCFANQNVGKRQQLEMELEQKNNYISTILNTASALVVVLDLEGRIVSFNQACEQTSDYLYEQVSNKYIWEFLLLPEDVEIWHSTLAAVVTRSPMAIETYWMTRNGDRLLIAWTFSVLRDRQGGVEGVICTGINVLSCQQVEQKLENTTRLQNAILNSANYAIIATDLEGTISTFNVAAQNWLGYSYQEIVGKTTPNIFHDPSEVVQRAQELSQLGITVEPGFEVFTAKARQGQPDEREWYYIRKDGSRFLVMLSVTALIDVHGSITGFLGIASDITNRKQAELALRESEERFKAFMDNSPVMAFIKDEQNRMVYINEPFERKFQVKLADLRGKQDDEWVPQESAKQTPENDMIVFSTGKAVETVETLPTPDGSQYWLVSKFLLNNVNAKPLLGCVAMDITERKNAEDRIKAALQEKEILLKEVHHRVKNNLQVIDSLFRHQYRHINNDEVIYMLKECQNRVASMALLHEKLCSSKNLSKINVAEYIKSLAINLFNSYSNYGNLPNINVNVDRVLLDFDLALNCGLIINELVTNSLKYAFPNGKVGEININFFKLNSHDYKLIIRDNGVGFSTEPDLKNIKSLGLKLVRSLVRQLDGEVEINNINGAEFNIIFPLNNYGVDK